MNKLNLKLRLFKGKTHADGTHPIQLQFYMNGKEKRKGIYFCHAKDWDEKTSRVKSKVTNSAYINNLLSEKYAEYERELLKIMDNGSDPDQFFNVKKELTLDDAINIELNRLQSETKPMTYRRIKSYANELKNYLNSENIYLKNIDRVWFEKYANFLTSDVTQDNVIVRKRNAGVTAQKKVKDIRRIIEKHAKNPLLEDVKNFRVKSKKSVKQKLTQQELILIENLELEEGKLIAIVRDIFLLQVYLRGARIGSLLMAYSNQFADGRYMADKNMGKNNVDSKLIPKAQTIVNKYFGRYERLFPLYNFSPNPNLSEYENKKKAFKLKESKTTIVNKYLKIIAKKTGITKTLSSHVARHTFARMAIDKINNPMVTMDLLGHRSLAVHQVYLNDIRKEDALDDAADNIFNS